MTWITRELLIHKHCGPWAVLYIPTPAGKFSGCWDLPPQRPNLLNVPTCKPQWFNVANTGSWSLLVWAASSEQFTVPSTFVPNSENFIISTLKKLGNRDVRTTSQTGRKNTLTWAEFMEKFEFSCDRHQKMARTPIGVHLLNKLFPSSAKATG